MKFILLLGLIMGIFALIRSALAQSPAVATRPISPAEAARRVRADQAILVDVREPGEWRSGVAAPAYLLPLSDLRGKRLKWKQVLDSLADREVLLYCRSGGRCEQAAAILAKEGIKVGNVGGFGDWQTAHLPVRGPDEPAAND